MAAKYLLPFLAPLLFIHVVLDYWLASANGASIATYWGQNREEGNLAMACATGNYDYINIAFLATFGEGRDPVLDLSGHCNATDHGCIGLGLQIRGCQKRGVKVMLSLGGDNGQQSLDSADDARQVARYLYNSFLAGQSWPRPFGSAVLDGIDFSVVGKTRKDRKHWEDLATALAEYSSAARKVYLTAAPQCSYPDKTLKKALRTGLFDVAWVRFYNHASCRYSEDGLGALLLSWGKWNAKVEVSEVFIGLPASGEAAEDGYVPPGNFTADVLPFISLFPKYGGILLWDRYYDMMSNYSDQVKYDVKTSQAKSKTFNLGLL